MTAGPVIRYRPWQPMKAFLSGRRKGWLKNIGVKLFSVAGALLLWFYVATDDRFDHNQKVSLQLVNQPQGVILTDPIPSDVLVRFRGSGRDLLTLMSRDKHIEIDLGAVNRSASIVLDRRMIQGIPTDMDVEPLRIVEPETVHVRMDRRAVKSVPVLSNAELRPLDGYIQVGSIILDPDSIVISGPRMYVSDVSEIPTETVVFDHLMKEIDGRLPLVPPAYETLVYSETSVAFSADFQRIGERIISEIPIVVEHVPRGLRVTAVPSTLSLKLQGGVNVLSGMRAEDVVATIDYRSRYRYSGNKIPATIVVPEGITFSESRPQSFELVVER